MWPFSKRKPKKDPAQQCIDELREFRDIGETFNYLGRTCIVTAHWEYWPEAGRCPRLKADYADNDGVIHQIQFRMSELTGLRKQNQ